MNNKTQTPDLADTMKGRPYNVGSSVIAELENPGTLRFEEFWCEVTAIHFEPGGNARIDLQLTDGSVYQNAIESNIVDVMYYN